MVTKLARNTQKVLAQVAIPPTGKRYHIRDMDEECLRRWQSLFMNNDKVQKQTRKFRAEYWASNQVDDLLWQVFAASGSDQDCRAQLEEATKIMKQRQLKLPPYHKKDGSHVKDSSESEEVESVMDAELVAYDLQATPLTYNLLQLRYSKQIDISFQTQSKKPKDRELQFKCAVPASKAGKTGLMQQCLDMMSKKQPVVCYQSNQAEHLVGAQSFQIASQIQQLVNWIDPQPKKEQSTVKKSSSEQNA